MKDKIYIILKGEYESISPVGYTDTKENADHICAVHNLMLSATDANSWDEWWWDELEPISPDVIVESIYYHTVVFKKKGSTFEMQNTPDKWKLIPVSADPKTRPQITLNETLFSDEITIKVPQKVFNRSEAESIANAVLRNHVFNNAKWY